MARTAADVTDAELAIADSTKRLRTLADSEAMARLLLRAEAVASSRIEGLEIGGRRLLKAELPARAGRRPPRRHGDRGPQQHRGDALGGRTAERAPADRRRRHPRGARAAPRRHAARASCRPAARRCRTGSEAAASTRARRRSCHRHPNWSRTSWRTCASSATTTRCRRSPKRRWLTHSSRPSTRSSTAMAARAARSIHVILRRRGLAPQLVPPISLVLATWSADYIDGLTRTRYLGDPDARKQRGTNAWIALFAGACRRAVADAEAYERQVAELRQAWRARLGRVRRDSATELLLAPFRGADRHRPERGRTDRPQRAGRQRSDPTARRARVLAQTTIGQRNRAFEAPELIDSFTALERRLASPEADTRTSPPARPVPRERRR